MDLINSLPLSRCSSLSPSRCEREWVSLCLCVLLLYYQFNKKKIKNYNCERSKHKVFCLTALRNWDYEYVTYKQWVLCRDFLSHSTTFWVLCFRFSQNDWYCTGLLVNALCTPRNWCLFHVDFIQYCFLLTHSQQYFTEQSVPIY